MRQPPTDGCWLAQLPCEPKTTPNRSDSHNHPEGATQMAVPGRAVLAPDTSQDWRLQHHPEDKCAETGARKLLGEHAVQPSGATTGGRSAIANTRVSCP
jgi:hypothetical protein